LSDADLFPALPEIHQLGGKINATAVDAADLQQATVYCEQGAGAEQNQIPAKSESSD